MYKLASLLGGALKLKTGVVVSRGKRARKIPRAPWKSGFTTAERPPILPREFTIPTRSLGNVFPDSKPWYSGSTESKHNFDHHLTIIAIHYRARTKSLCQFYNLQVAIYAYILFFSLDNFRSSFIPDKHSTLTLRIPSSSTVSDLKITIKISRHAWKSKFM